MPILTSRRLSRRTKPAANPKRERVSGIYLQEQLTGLALSDQAKGPACAHPPLPAETVLAERQCLACCESAASPLFIP